MGAVNFSIDTSLIAALKQALPLSVFVETGTFEGETIRRARPFFESIYSVEVSEKYHAMTARQFQGDPSVHIHRGDSPEFLRKLSSSLNYTSVLYWLDAHWCVAEESGGEHSQCPLLEELNAISGLNDYSVILIDDARSFLCPPPRPHEVSHWPSFDCIVKKLYSLSSSHELMVINDVIIYFPASVKPAVIAYAHDHSVDWLTIADKSRDYDVLLSHLEEKEDQIKLLTDTAASRLELINKLYGDIQEIRKSSFFKLGFALSHPWRAIKKIF